MEMSLGSVIGTGWASGINLYGTVLLLGLFGRLDIAETPELLQSTPVLIGAAVLYLVEFVVDKIPYLDSGWDVVHTAVRPIGAALLGALLAGEALPDIIPATVSGVTALASHATKAGTRLAVNASPEPASNIAVSLLEDGLVVGVVWFAVTYPWIAAGLSVLLLAGGVVLMVAMWKVIRRGFQRLRGARAET
jgi:hypothetical protein